MPSGLNRFENHGIGIETRDDVTSEAEAGFSVKLLSRLDGRSYNAESASR